MAGVTIGGSLTGAPYGNLVGKISSEGDLGLVRIGGHMTGGRLIESSHRIRGVTIGGSIISGASGSGSIRAGDDIGSLIVKGGVLGDSGSPVFIIARGQAAATATTDLAIGSTNIGGRVEHIAILGGYQTFPFDSDPIAMDGNAQIGSVILGGDWIASSIVAGVEDTNHDGFGNSDDAVIGGGAPIAKIASILIKGIVVGTGDSSSDHFGFESHEIGAFSSVGFIAAFLGGPTGCGRAVAPYGGCDDPGGVRLRRAGRTIPPMTRRPRERSGRG